MNRYRRLKKKKGFYSGVAVTTDAEARSNSRAARYKEAWRLAGGHQTTAAINLIGSAPSSSEDHLIGGSPDRPLAFFSRIDSGVLTFVVE
jgi:hypothetical protein